MTKSPVSLSTSDGDTTTLSLKHWLIGLVGSWTIVWLMGPLLLNSILVRVLDPVLGVITHRPHAVVHWRSEGCGTTLIGPHGLPGWQPRNQEFQPPLKTEKTSLDQAMPRIVIWGDSQVEGFCVADSEKIHNQTIAIASAEHEIELDCLPMGRSGSDARHWMAVMPNADRLWQPDLHVWVLTDLSDLTDAVTANEKELTGSWATASPKWVQFAAAVHAQSLFAAAKRIFYDPSTDRRRRLDFSLGPRDHLEPKPLNLSAENQSEPVSLAALVASMLARLDDEYDHRLVVLYAPGTPRLMGELVTEHPDDEVWNEIRHLLDSQGIGVVDLRTDFINLWHTQSKLPRGFHNGMPGYGHLNSVGNRLVASGVIQLWKESLSRQR